MCDEYGDPLPIYDNGSMFLPENVHGEFVAMTLVSTTGMSYDSICELSYDEFRRVAAIARAKAWQPKTKNKGDKYL